MFQTVGHQAIEYYAEAMNLPLFRGEIKGSSVNIGSNYVKTDLDEVEDLLELLQEISKKIEFDAICSGAILSDYQRVRVENV
jgi:diphthine-ammonia ligase